MNNHVSVKGMKRGQLARQTGCNLETIRYYEKIDLMPDPPRTASGYRVYDETHVARLRFVLRGRELGFSIEDIRGLLSLVDLGTQTCVEIQDLTEQHLQAVRAKILDLQRIEKVLAETAAQCTGDEAPTCAVLEALTS